MSCDPEGVTGYVDGVLESSRREEVEAHLAGCPACREQAEFERGLRQRLRALAPVATPPGLSPKVQSRLRGPRGRWLRFALPLAACFALLALWVRGAAPFLAWELARDHRSCFGKPRLPAQVWGNDAARVTAWFDAQGTRVPMAPDAAGGLELMGARYCPLVDRLVAHLYYAGEDRSLSLFVVPGLVRMEAGHSARVRGHSVRLLRVGGTVVGLVSAREETVDAFERSLTTTFARNDIDWEGAALPR